MLIDAHAHLNFPDYQKDLDQVAKRAAENSVNKIICVSSNVTDSQKAIEIAKKYPEIVYPAIGIHPQQTDPENMDSLEKQIEKLTKLAEKNQAIAIGECGLDYSPAPPGEKDRNKKEQFFLFKKQIELAQKLSLPLIIHCRKAFPEIIEILNQYAGHSLKGVFHCYSAGKKGIEKVNQLDFYFGVDGNLTYDVGLQNVFAQIPLEKILLETDAPFLSPEPLRNQRNEPKNVKMIAECLAQLKNVSFEKICQITTKNVKKLFSF
ncbi:MAG TPA: TatD family hydrolase [Nevskiaceae bacterium]|nr:TatD family hydrolase [Nevskiaceae bacterium]